MFWEGVCLKIYLWRECVLKYIYDIFQSLDFLSDTLSNVEVTPIKDIDATKIDETILEGWYVVWCSLQRCCEVYRWQT